MGSPDAYGAGNSIRAYPAAIARTVYPRRCGEQSRSWGASRSRVGLSPQVRGTGLGQGANAVERRFIPAGAGNRRWTLCGKPTPTVYPRRCGEQRVWGPLPAISCGLSPQVRGTAELAGLGLALARFIPAGAGNSTGLYVLSAKNSVYPRRCGEQAQQGADDQRFGGLSPQVRGTVDDPHAHRAGGRFIPAGAGNRGCRPCLCLLLPVYPRRCGEQVLERDRHLVAVGLSPQVRGTVFQGPGLFGLGRFIPAGAGNRWSKYRVTISTSVYPRRCGEQTPPTKSPPSAGGLSPQVRGTGLMADPAPRNARFIPAGAGNSFLHPPNWPPGSVYPRRCGEQRVQVNHDYSPSGLSPQVRGTGHEDGTDEGRGRFIPAGAGNSEGEAPAAWSLAVYPRRCGEQKAPL